MAQSKRDFPQVLKAVFNEAEQALQVTGVLVPGGTPIPVIQENTLVPVEYDSISLTYVPSGDGVGQIQTVTYYTGGLSGTQVALLTLGYDSGNNLISVVKS
jgi:hypothetical protein